MLSEMRAFMMFADAGSIQEAARRLNLTQSAVTRQIQRLERGLDAALLDRRIKPPVLTAAGRSALERCRKVLREVAELKASAASTGTPVGSFRVGVGYVLADDEFVECVHAVNKAFPRLAISIKTDWHPALIEMVRQNRLDVAVIPSRPDMPLPADVGGAVIGTEPLVFVIGAGADVGAVPTLDRLATLPWIVKPGGTGTREVLDAEFAREGLTLGAHSEVRDENLQLSLVARGLGAALVTRRSIKRHPYKRRVRLMRVKGLNVKLHVVMIRHGYLGYLGAAADVLQKHLQTCYAKDRHD
jgi:DNA-binding transcriptional LysR family regulator